MFANARREKTGDPSSIHEKSHVQTARHKIFHGLLMAAAILPVAISPVVLPRSAFAGDWPQVLGPQRNGQAENEQLFSSWPSGGPQVVWKKTIGQGYAGPAVVGSRLLLFHRVDDLEVCEARDTQSGRILWKTSFPTRYRSRINPDDGPRAAPVVQGGRVFLFGAAGTLHCVNLQTGEKHWSRDVYADYQGSEGFFGAGSTPIVLDDRLILNVGGRAGAGLVAFSTKNGATLWQATDEEASYSSPATGVFGGRRHVIFATRLNAISIDPANGKTLFKFPFGVDGSTVTAATPLLLDGHVFYSAAYGAGAYLAKIGPQGATKVWANDDSMSSQYTTCVRRGNYLYGMHGREDYANGQLRCIDWRTGKVQWSKTGFGVGHLIAADDKLLVVTNDGKLTLAKADPTAFQVLAQANVFGATVRALPALSNGRLYIRTNGADNSRLWCVQVGAAPKR